MTICGGLECGQPTTSWIKSVVLHIPKTSWSKEIKYDEPLPICGDCVERTKEWIRANYFPAPLTYEVRIHAVLENKREVIET